ncbi:MAG TPA: glycoside hydrolase family 97 catalytic domain-containing protein [Terracidiphilus sp.]|jgi:alpha-glucosidase|nr:glycoside hydrolase family 97 catalytic domain-containing protein [Terracidiphilus sp.]
MNRYRRTLLEAPCSALIRFASFALAAACIFFCGSTALFAKTQSLVLKSPRGVLTLHVDLDASGSLSYSVNRGEEPVLLPSRLGFEPDWVQGFTIASSARTHHSEYWKPLYGDRDRMPNVYNELTVKLAGPDGHSLAVEFRAYDEGVALRYGAEEPMNVSKELTDFHWPAKSFGYEEHGTEGKYSLNAISKIAPHCQTPLTVTLADGTYAAILEAANVTFPQMTVGAEPGSEDTLIAELGGPGTLPAGGFTPWRLLMFASTPGELLEHDYLELDLNARDAIANPSWIKPGTAMREVTLSTAGARTLIDFASAHHIPYIGFDAGWYGSEDYETGDATHERTTDKRGQPAPPLNIQDVVRYGKQHGVGVWVYIDHKQAERQRDILFPLYEKWGLAGVKIGFVTVGSQQNTEWITETIRKAAEYHLMLDIHDSYRTTGYTRTYPNLLTVEGIRGNEHFPTPEHNATIPFTRYLAGSADYTICYYDRRLTNTHAHQLAMSIISYSPLQWIFWYDRPSDFHGEPEIGWFTHLPTVWDETRVPLGEIGKYAVIARRSGDDWYVGAIGDSAGVNLHLPMKFLKAGATYDATIYSDDASVHTATHVGITHRKVTSTSVIDLPLGPAGGEAIYLTPAGGAGQ